MAALTQAYEAFERPGLVVAYKASNAKIHKGAMVGVNSAGYVVRMDPAASGLRFVGVANETVDNASGSAGDRSINVTKSGSFVVKPASGYTPAIADLGKEAYASSDWEIQISSTGLTNAVKVGTIVALESTSTGSDGVRIRIDNYTV